MKNVELEMKVFEDMVKQTGTWVVALLGILFSGSRTIKKGQFSVYSIVYYGT